MGSYRHPYLHSSSLPLLLTSLPLLNHSFPNSPVTPLCLTSFSLWIKLKSCSCGLLKLVSAFKALQFTQVQLPRLSGCLLDKPDPQLQGYFIQKPCYLPYLCSIHSWPFIKTSTSYSLLSSHVSCSTQLHHISYHCGLCIKFAYVCLILKLIYLKAQRKMGRSKEKTQEKRNNELLSNGSFKFCNVWIRPDPIQEPKIFHEPNYVGYHSCSRVCRSRKTCSQESSRRMKFRASEMGDRYHIHSAIPAVTLSDLNACSLTQSISSM